MQRLKYNALTAELEILFRIQNFSKGLPVKRSLALLALLLAAVLGFPAYPVNAQPAHKRIGVAFYSQTIPLYVDMRAGMIAEAAKRGVDLEFQYSGPDAQQQANQIANFVTKKVDLILCSPFDKNALINAYKAARAAGVPIMSVANDIADQSNEEAFVGTDWSRFGRMEMTAVVKAIKGSGFVYGWHQGALQVLAKNPNVKVVADLNGPLTIEAGLNEANNILTAHPDVKALVANSDELAQGAAQALKEHGIKPGTVFVAGWDGYPQTVTMIKNNAGIDYTIANGGFSWGALAVDTAADFLAGKKLKQKMVFKTLYEVTHENVNSLTDAQLK